MNKKSHGGKRSGSGRPKGTGKYKEPTKVMRIPQSMVPQVLEVVEEGISMHLPLYACRVSAGFPSPADDYLEDEVSLQQLIIRNPSATFYVRCQGDSMIDAGIHDQDIMVVDRSVDAADGKIIVAVLNGELTVKRLSKKKKEIWLLPENKKYEPIQVTEESRFMVWGVVTCVLHHV